MVRFLLLMITVVSAEESSFQFWGKVFWNVSLYPTLPIAMPDSLDESCRADSKMLMAHLQNQTVWAMKMWDSSATSSFGVLYGNQYHLGSYDECLTVRVPIRAQFCNVRIKATVHVEDDNGDPYDIDPEPTSTVWRKFKDSRLDHTKYARDVTHWGLCVPASCSRKEVEKGINEYLNQLNKERMKENGTTYAVEIPQDYCHDGEPDDLAPAEIAFWVFTSCLIAVVILATCVDSSGNPDEELRPKRILMSFSLRRTLPLLTSKEDTKEGSHLGFLHGIKVVTIGFIVLDHHVMFNLAAAVINKQDMELALRSWQNMFLPNGDLLVDTCFFIGGVLVTHLYLEHSDKIRASLPLIIMSRLFRLAPLYFFVIWFQSSALSRFGSGPAWKFGLKEEIEFCRKNWWANLLFIQNYVRSDEMCMLHAWYLPCDFHFFIVAVLIVTIIKKNKAVGVATLYMATLISIITPGVITFFYSLNPTVEFWPKFLENPRSDSSFQLLYVKSHTRIAVYLVGMITAYHLYSKRHSTWKISRKVSILGCLLGLGLLFAPMAYGGSTYYDPRRKYNLIEATIFACVRRLLWAFAWVVFLVVNRFGIIPIFGKVFVWRISVPLSRMTYAVYLIHFLLQMSDLAKVRIPYQFIPFDMFVKGINDLFFSVGYAFVLHLFLELPFRVLFKELLFPRSKPEQQQPKKYLQSLPESSKCNVIKL